MSLATPPHGQAQLRRQWIISFGYAPIDSNWMRLTSDSRRMLRESRGQIVRNRDAVNFFTSYKYQSDFGTIDHDQLIEITPSTDKTAKSIVLEKIG